MINRRKNKATVYCNKENIRCPLFFSVARKQTTVLQRLNQMNPNYKQMQIENIRLASFSFRNKAK